MLKQFLNHIADHQLINPGGKTLLAVSGGVDSMVMLHLFIKAGFNIAVAHCNFQLRGEASDGDEQLVREVCHRNNITCHVRRFDTVAYADENKLSTQEAARNLRYNFFAEIVRSEKCSRIATAHHADDSVETVLLNLIRGTGIDGMTGIGLINGQVIRPLLFARRHEIIEYAKAEGICWRDDASNMSDDYQRNFLRLNVIPLLNELKEGFTDTMQENIRRMQAYTAVVADAVSRLHESCVRYEGSRTIIDAKSLKQIPGHDILLWELIKHHGFRFDQIRKILVTDHSGKHIASGNTILLFDRDKFILEESTATDEVSAIIHENDRRAETAFGKITLEYIGVNGIDELIAANAKKPDVAFMDADKVAFPLTWRKWQSGDALIPFGMKSTKKVSDMLIDAKVDVLTKSRVSVIESGGTIIWLAGMRVSETVRITRETRRVLVMKLN